jgi:hypothetical protein
VFEASKLSRPLLLNRIVFREIGKSGQPPLDLRGCFLVGLQVEGVTSNQVSSLACFCIDQKAKNITQLFLDFMCPLNLIVQSVITQGSTAGVRDHPKSEKQPHAED